MWGLREGITTLLLYLYELWTARIAGSPSITLSESPVSPHKTHSYSFMASKLSFTLLVLLPLTISPFACNGEKTRILVATNSAQSYNHCPDKIDGPTPFKLFSKGVPIPPSGPSNRHNVEISTVRAQRIRVPWPWSMWLHHSRHFIQMCVEIYLHSY